MAGHSYYHSLLRFFIFAIIVIILFVMNTTQLVVVQCDDMVSITTIDSAVSQGAVCLDGSPPGYHLAEGSKDGVNNWMVYLLGGGWCSTTSECLQRCNSPLGSTRNITTTYFGGILSQNQVINQDFYNWNRVIVRYCDGGSFMGDVEAVDPLTKIYYRGARIFKAVVQDLLAKGMENAQNVMLVGNSAGGLATILNCDRFRALVSNASRLKCVSDSGFFLRGKDRPGAKEREAYYGNVVALHGLSKTLPTPCTSKMDPRLCIFPENIVDGIQTPLFILNSAFDAYQISYNFKPRDSGDQYNWNNCVVDLKTCTSKQIQIIKDFRSTYLNTLQELGNVSSRGEFINSCYIHDFLYKRYNWNDSPKLENKSIAEAIGDWYFDRSVIDEIDTVNDYPLYCNMS